MDWFYLIIISITHLQTESLYQKTLLENTTSQLQNYGS